MQVTFQVTGSTAEAVRGAVHRQLDALDPSVDWQLAIDVSPAFRCVEGATRFDWCGDVTAWDGQDSPPPHLSLLGDGE